MCAAFEIGGGGYLLFGGDGVALNFHGFYPHRKNKYKNKRERCRGKAEFYYKRFYVSSVNGNRVVLDKSPDSTVIAINTAFNITDLKKV